MNLLYGTSGALQCVLSNRGLGINAKKCLYKLVTVRTSLYGAGAWGMRSAERRKVNVPEMKCLRSLVGVSRMYWVRNEDVPRTAEIERVLASLEDQRVLRWFGHVERMDEYRMARKVLMAKISEGLVLGRLRLGRMDGLKVAFGSRGMTVRLRDNAKDRREWRNLVYM